jgi:uncharacterized membrane protein (UPF0127 family)
MKRSSWASSRVRLWILGAALALPVGCAASSPPPSQDPGIPGQIPERGAGGQSTVEFGKGLVIFGEDTVRAEVASTPEQRERGLMYRTDVPAGTGMLFVFPDAQERSFWMSNTYVALDVAFMDENLRITGIQHMEAESTEYHDSTGPMMYGLEVPKGWFAAHGVKVGDRAQLVMGSG